MDLLWMHFDCLEIQKSKQASMHTDFKILQIHLEQRCQLRNDKMTANVVSRE